MGCSGSTNACHLRRNVPQRLRIRPRKRRHRARHLLGRRPRRPHTPNPPRTPSIHVNRINPAKITTPLQPRLHRRVRYLPHRQRHIPVMPRHIRTTQRPRYRITPCIPCLPARKRIRRRMLTRQTRVPATAPGRYPLVGTACNPQATPAPPPAAINSLCNRCPSGSPCRKEHKATPAGLFAVCVMACPHSANQAGGDFNPPNPSDSARPHSPTPPNHPITDAADQTSLPFSLTARMLRAEAARRRSQYSHSPAGA